MIKLEVNMQSVPLKFITFSGGEEQVVIDPDNDFGIFDQIRVQVVEVIAHIKSSKEVMQLVVLTDAIRRLSDNGNVRYYLNMPYVPYARQDRVMQPGEALSIKAFASIINGLKYDRVFISDPHSDVTAVVIENLVVQDQTACFFEAIDQSNDLRRKQSHEILVVAPDAGARKKAAKTAKHFGWDLVEAGKVRDVTTGAITGTEVYGDVAGRDCLILDDICDGGMTFIKLGEALKAKGAARVRLYVTHGIFSKGKDVFKGSVDEVICLHDWTEGF